MVLVLCAQPKKTGRAGLVLIIPLSGGSSLSSYCFLTKSSSSSSMMAGVLASTRLNKKCYSTCCDAACCDHIRPFKNHAGDLDGLMGEWPESTMITQLRLL